MSHCFWNCSGTSQVFTEKIDNLRKSETKCSRMDQVKLVEHSN